jgi:hypothetical protein
MSLYTKLDTLPKETYALLLKYFFNICQKVNIYFPTDCTAHLAAYKNSFLDAIDIHESCDEFSALEPKEGFTMVIASLTPAVFEHLLQIPTSDFHLSFGLILDDEVRFYVDEDGGLILDCTDFSFLGEKDRHFFKEI